MENLHEKIEGLHEKLDQLQLSLQLLPEQIAQVLRSPSVNAAPPPALFKDVLPEEEETVSRPPSSNGRMLSPEAQIQRLTAQLTAAYNRIAALEEQLMSRRSSY